MMRLDTIQLADEGKLPYQCDRFYLWAELSLPLRTYVVRAQNNKDGQCLSYQLLTYGKVQSTHDYRRSR